MTLANSLANSSTSVGCTIARRMLPWRMLAAAIVMVTAVYDCHSANAQQEKEKTTLGQVSNSTAATPDPGKETWQTIVDNAVEFLRVSGQAENGSFSDQSGIGVTAVVTTGLLSVDVNPNDPLVADAIAFILKYQQPDGGIYEPSSKHQNYETCLSIMTLARANEGGRYDDVLANAEKYIKDRQWGQSLEAQPEDLEYGGAGYGSHSRPDLSNTSFLIEALRDLGRDETDPAMQRALTFVSRCQNFESEYNSAPFGALVDDGGFFYTAAAGGETKAEVLPNGGLRSYGSMTYAGLKSMIFAGVDRDDKRVQAAREYLSANYSVDQNPGMGSSGLFYYYHVMAKAFAALETQTFKSSDGVEHDWQAELLTQFKERQRDSGAWVNEDARWLEGDANLVTGYALLSLSHLKPNGN